MTAGLVNAAADGARSQTRVRVSALHAPTLATLVDQLGDPSTWVVSDLSLGAWRTRQAATELGEQLDLQSGVDRGPTAVLPPRQVGDWLHTYADLVGAGIESEAQGDLGLLAALDAADRIAAAADGVREPPVLLVIAPLPGIAWLRDDRQLVEALAGLQAAARWRLVVGFPAGARAVPEQWAPDWRNEPSDRPPPPPPGRAVLMPGVVHDGTLGPGVASVGLRNDRALVAPEARRAPGSELALEYDGLLASVPRDSWVAAYAQCFCNNLFVDPGQLAAQAGIRFGEGGGELALRLLNRAVGCARSPAERAGLLAQLQGMRIGLRRYADAASAADPSPATPPTLAGFLHQMKGWGLALSGGPEAGRRAVEHLDAAHRLLDGRIGEREWLYLLNIEALGRVAVRDATGATELELEVERRVSRLSPPDRRLEYVNSLNLARLARRRGAGEAARRLYERAFATTSGLRSESDAFYVNLCQARLEADSGRPGEALLAWVRCALHWLSCAAPQALSARAVSNLLGSPCDADGSFVGDAHRALNAALAAAAGDVDGLIVDELDAVPPRFARVRPPGAVGLRGIGAAGLGVIAADRPPAPEPPAATDGDPGWALRARTRDLLAALVPAGALSRAGLIVVGENAGRELPATAVELVDACLRDGATRVAWTEAAFELPETVHAVLAAMSRVALGPGVESVGDDRPDAVTVSFRRYRNPVSVAGAGADVVRRLAGRPTVGELTADGSVDLAALRRLELDRVVSIGLEEDACTAAGIRLPTSATS